MEAMCKFKKKELFRLLSYLPYLQEIDLSGCDGCNNYIDFMCTFDSTRYLTGIKSIYAKSQEFDQDQHAHFKTCYNFRATLTHVALYQSKNATITLDGQTGKALTFSHKFEYLNHLEFINNDEDPDDLTMYDVSTICPKLQLEI